MLASDGPGGVPWRSGEPRLQGSRSPDRSRSRARRTGRSQGTSSLQSACWRGRARACHRGSTSNDRRDRLCIPIPRHDAPTRGRRRDRGSTRGDSTFHPGGGGHVRIDDGPLIKATNSSPPLDRSLDGRPEPTQQPSSHSRSGPKAVLLRAVLPRMQRCRVRLTRGMRRSGACIATRRTGVVSGHTAVR